MKPAPFPLIAPRHGAFAQARSGLDQHTLFRGWSRLTMGCAGVLAGRPLDGFFVADTLFVSRYRVLVDGNPLQLTLASQLSPSEWCGLFVARRSMEEGNIPAGRVPRGSLDLRITRSLPPPSESGVWPGIWNESLLFRSHSSEPRVAEIVIEFRCPIADVQFAEEMKTEFPEPDAVIAPEVLESGPQRARLRFSRSYGPRRKAPTQELFRLLGPATPKDGEEVLRSLELVAEVHGASETQVRLRPEHSAGKDTRLRATLEIGPRGQAELQLCFHASNGQFSAEAGAENTPSKTRPLPTTEPSKANGSSFEILTGNPTLQLMLSQAEIDFHSLALPFPAPGAPNDNAHLFGELLSAGVPRYIGIFSRDILTASWQGSLLSRRYLHSALTGLSLFRGVRHDAWRDEEINQIPHEIRLNPMAAAGHTNREAYYGDVVSTVFWLVTLATAFHWNGDRELLRMHADTIETCCQWIERRLKHGNGFIYYSPAHPEGNRHHAWKDSGDAIVDAHGRIVEPPLATCEVQGFCFLGLLAAAELALAQGRLQNASHRYACAQELKRRFNQAFWLEREAYYAVALDRDGRPVDSVTSNPGHCLGCGIIATDRVPAVVSRLFADDLFSGWGIRTLSDHNPAYDPYSYHRGTVWPVENATIAGGLRLWGYDDHASRLIEAQLSTATLFPQMRLPEALSGHPRSENYPIPGVYPDGNLLQAWSVSAITFSLMILLGLRPMAPLGLLLVKPHLPPWLPWVELRDLRVGGGLVSLRFWRDPQGRSRWEVLRKQGTLKVLQQPAEADPEASFFTRLKEAFQKSA